ncbi:hypothetical protein HYH03_019033 [Edaphochlamys debaryana]|uniref:Peptidylprolyl isomerase n=1 Tax=Edaphochlamys debaryana TaxID=47281 RepID=A0A835XES0_9CHLO|nr:hypothetical protein HYH03_019033 [Edaphochlamys debaryana]|eukprot:KAG2482009.1 hypothetical protein HYH03_019033 [Edaphochlamys debaryana]
MASLRAAAGAAARAAGWTRGFPARGALAAAWRAALPAAPHPPRRWAASGPTPAPHNGPSKPGPQSATASTAGCGTPAAAGAQLPAQGAAASLGQGGGSASPPSHAAAGTRPSPSAGAASAAGASTTVSGAGCAGASTLRASAAAAGAAAPTCRSRPHPGTHGSAAEPTPSSPSASSSTPTPSSPPASSSSSSPPSARTDSDPIGQALAAAAARRQRLAAALAGGAVRVVIECGLAGAYTGDAELRSLAKQVQTAVRHNRSAERPVCLTVTSWTGPLAAFADERMGACGWDLDRREQPVHELFPPSRLVVLSPDADTPLTALDEGAVYVVGGVVDRSVRKGVTAGYAAHHGLEARRLPTQELAEQLGLGRGAAKRPVLNIDDVVLALLRLRDSGGDWLGALDAAIPQRKRAAAAAAAVAAGVARRAAREAARRAREEAGAGAPGMKAGAGGVEGVEGAQEQGHMGKKQHQKDRLFLTTKEWKEEWGGHKGARSGAPFKRLPFHCCAIHFTPFEDPACTDDGTVYDITAIVPYIMKYKRHPVSGEPLALKDITRLNFAKNGDGEFVCPVMGKVFTEHTHIVALKPTGNVYCWEAVEELCVKPKNWRDLLTDEPFTRKDIIHIQDPLNLSGRAIENFDHVKKSLILDEDEEAAAAAASCLRNVTEDMKRALGALQSDDAKAAFASGGGGKRAEAARLLAEAKLKAGGAAGGSAAAAAAERQGGSGPASTSAAASGPSGPPGAAGGGGGGGGGGGDWRLRAPERNDEAPSFKPGAMTWDTEDRTAAAGAAGAGAAGGKGKGKQGGKPAGATPPPSTDEANGGKPSPAEWYEAQGHVKYIESATTTGAASRSFTSTAWAPTAKNERARTRLQRVPAKKGYVRLHTNLGDLNVEVDCDLAPRTAENFLALCSMGYYTGTTFHRSIKNFMIQGGDPTGTGKGGESIYGPTFKDELDSRLVHAGRGVLSMANSGPNTNGSQFFITYKSCRHLDFKHSVFGRVVGGLEVLAAMEKTPVDPDDRPTSPITITGATVFTNPFFELEEEEAKKEAAERRKREKEEAAASDPLANKVGSWYSQPSSALAEEGGARPAPAAGRGGVGKYIGALAARAAAAAAPAGDQAQEAGGKGAGEGRGGAGGDAGAGAGAKGEPPVKKAKVGGGFGNFDSW